MLWIILQVFNDIKHFRNDRMIITKKLLKQIILI